jgi:hypothetical protein
MSMSCAAIKRFSVGNGAVRLALDPNTGEPIVNAEPATGEPLDWRTAGAEIDIQVRALAAEQGIGYRDAVTRVLAHPGNEGLVAAYTHRAGPGEKLVPRTYAVPVDDPEARAAAGAKLHNLVVAEMQRNPGKTYAEVAAAVVNHPAAAALRRSWIGLSE